MRRTKVAALAAATVMAAWLPTPAVAAPPPPTANTSLTTKESRDQTHYQVLVFSTDTSPATEAGFETIRRMGATTRKFDAKISRDPKDIDPLRLQRFGVIVFLNTSAAVLTADQKATFESFFRNGGGFVGIHSAIQTQPDWQFLTDVLGTRSTGMSPVSQATVKVADRVHPASAGLPEYWRTTDAFYNFAADVRGKSHVLATVDETTYAGGSMGADHPIMWCKDYQGGRSFYTGLGETAAQFADPTFQNHLAGAIDWAEGNGTGDCGATVLANYQMDVVAAPPNIGEPIEIEVLPDGRVLQTTRTGEVRLHNPRTGTTQVIARIPVYSHDEDGLYGGAIDAQFGTNNWVYLYYAPPLNTPTTDAPTGSNDPHAWDVYRGYNQLSRFKFVDGPTPSLDMASEQKIMQVGTDRGACCHVAGEIRFDSHGNLLMTTGDDTPAGSGNSGGFAPFNDELTVPAKAGCPDPCYNAPYVDARRSAGNTNDLRGKLLRIHVSDDGSYTIPSGNLFAPGTAGTRPEIYAMGFRNPFRLNLDPNDVAYVTDYSPDSNTPQVFRGPPGVGRMEIVRHAANYGWPLCASPTLPYYRWNFTTSTPLDNPPQPFSCGDPAKGPDNTSRHNTGLVTTPPLTAPDMWYSYNDNNPSNPLGTPCAAQYTQDPPGKCPQLFPELGAGGVGPHGAAPYHYDAANPNPTKFPAYYDKSIFFGEFTRDFLREIRLDSQGHIFKINDLLTCGDVSADRAKFPFVCDAPMDMRWGPDGNFYLLSYGDGFFRANPDALLVKFSYVKGLRAPTAVTSASRTSGQAPLTVGFSSKGSFDPDPGDSIRYAWDFNNDGTVDSTEANPTFTYTANGVYTAKLTVIDSNGKSAVSTQTIEVGNTAPTIALTAPPDGGFFAWGDRVPWSVTVTDPEDGPVDCGRVTVSFSTGGSQQGCSGVWQTSASDAASATLTASYTDLGANGQPPLSASAKAVVQQKRQQVENVTEQSGTSTGATTDPDGGGLNRFSIDAGDWVALPANLRNITSVSFRTAGGTGAVQLRLDAPNGPLLTTATIPATGGTGTYATQSFPVTDPGGTHKLYLVFQSVSGGPTTNLFGLNWVEFGGTGVAG